LYVYLLLVAHWYLDEHHGVVVAGVGVLQVGQCRRRRRRRGDGFRLDAVEMDVEAAEAPDEAVGALDEEAHDACVGEELERRGDVGGAEVHPRGVEQVDGGDEDVATAIDVGGEEEDRQQERHPDEHV
jgi:hypothetical protein